jgi:hypothetical protein
LAHFLFTPELLLILTTAEEIGTRMTASAKIALELRRPLPDNALRIVARGKNQNGPEQ